MAATLDTSALGLPVELGHIGRELKKIWERDSGISTRASLINFAVCCPGIQAMGTNTELLTSFTREHACRAILIGLEPHSDKDQIQAWINAHCHLSRAGAKQVCCEQISFLFEGKTTTRIPNVLYANLDSDLPLYLWWQGEFHLPIDEHLWAWVDRLIFDSQSWSTPKEQFTRLKASLTQAHSHLILCDLNWTRSLHLRQALAQMFDHPANLALLDQLQEISIVHAPENHTTATLVIGWFAAQFKLQLQNAAADGWTFTDSRGRPVRVKLTAEAGRSISRCEIKAESGSILCQRDIVGDFFRIEVRPDQEHSYHHLLPSGSSSTSTLLMEEISGGGLHRVYLKALKAAEALL